MRASGTNISATGHKAGLGNVLYDKAGARPDLDLDFARNKSLKDKISKENLITFTRSSGTGYGATYVDENGLVKVAPVNLARYSEDFSNSEWNDANTTVVANFAVAPDGTQTANKVTINPVSNSYLADAITTVAATYTISVWIKAVDPSNPGFFDLFSNASSPTSQLGKTQAPTEWTRFTKTVSARASYSGTYNFGINNAGDDYTAEVLAWGFQVEKGFVATEYIPTNGQALGAPRFTHDPVTKKSKGLLIEPAATNLIVSKDADSTWWSKTGISVTTIQTAPTGSVEANVLKAIVGNTSTKQMYHTTQSSNISALKYTFSVFLKKGTVVNSNDVSRALIKIGQNGEKAKAEIDLTNGTINVTTGTGSIENYGNDWYRAIITTSVALSASANVNSFVLVLKANGQNTYTGAGESIYFYGPQLEAGEAATSYIPTSGQLNGVTRSPDLATIEGDNFGTYRTNLVTNTSFRKDFDSYTTTKGIHQNYAALSPSGKFDAAKLTADPNVNSNQRLWKYVTVQASQKYSVSAYVKAGTSSRCAIGLYDGSPNGSATEATRFQVAYINLAADPPTINNTYITHTFTNTSVTDVGNGWYRVQFTSTAVPLSTSGAAGIIFLGDSTGNLTFAGNGESMFYWGLQVERADTPTEFIPSTDKYTNRQSNATFVDGNGIIRNSLVNHIKYSEDIRDNSDGTDWNHIQLSVTPNNVVAPDGTLTAATPSHDMTRYLILHFPTGGPNVFIVNKDIPITSEWQRFSDTFTVPSTGNDVRIYPLRNPNSESTGRFFYTSNPITLVAGETYTYSAWYKRINNINHVWGIQLVKGTEAGDYYKTTDTISGPPRYSHDPDTLTPTGLYLEPQSTNYLQNSSNFNHAFSTGGWAYATSTNPRVSYDYNIANPDGSLGAAYLNNNGSETYTNFDTTQYDADNDGSPDGTDTVTISCFVKAKANETNPLVIQLYSTQSNTLNISLGWLLQFDPTANNGEGNLAIFDPTQNNVVIGATTNPIKEKYPNGWFRVGCTVKVDPVTIDGVTYSQFANNARFDIQTRFNNQDGNDGRHYFWGPQVEVGDNLTSYIPTSGATATRSADIFTSTATEVLDRANGTKPAFYTKNGLTAFIRGTNQPNPPTYAFRFFEFDGGVGAGLADFSATANSAGTKLGVYQYTDTSHAEPEGTSSGGSSPNTTLGLDNKIAIRYQTDNLRVNTNSVEGPLIDSSVASGIDARSSNRLIIGTNGSASGVGTSRLLNGTIQRLTFWKTPFTDSKLDRLTS